MDKLKYRKIEMTVGFVSVAANSVWLGLKYRPTIMFKLATNRYHLFKHYV